MIIFFIYHENVFFLLFIRLSCISFHRSSMLEPKTNYQLFNMIIGVGHEDARTPNQMITACSAGYLSQSEHVVEQAPE